jgi:pimeloyl-ACP methyl ester carboxylesterase
VATFVLVHGTSVSGWCWKFVTPLLWQAGQVVYAPTMTGLGERAHLAAPAVDLDTHIEDIVQVLEFEDLRDVILVGWSYGGMVITGVADRVPERIAHLVYLDADTPRDEEMSVTSPERRAWREEEARRRGDGWRAMALPLSQLDSYLQGSLSDERLRWFISRLVPHPLKCWTQPIRLSNPALMEIPHAFVRCVVDLDPNDPDALRTNERLRTESVWQYREIDANHFAPITVPDLVAAVLLDIATPGVQPSG